MDGHSPGKRKSLAVARETRRFFLLPPGRQTADDLRPDAGFGFEADIAAMQADEALHQR